MRVWVTGGTGFIAGALLARLLLDGHDVFHPSRRRLDLLRPIGADAPPSGLDVLVHCAASRDRSDRGEESFSREIAMNLEATARLYECARRVGIPRIVHLSTSAVLRPGADSSLELPDDGPLVTPPAHPYALTKRWGEELALSLREDFHAIAVVRPGITYGPAMQDSCGMAHVVAQLRSGEPYPLAAPDGHRYAPVYIDDVIDVLVRLIEVTKNVTVTVPGEALWERQLCSDVAERIGVPLRLVSDARLRPLSLVPSTRALDALLPGRIKTPWSRGLRLTFGE